MGYDETRYSVECTDKANTPAVICIPGGLKHWRMVPRSYVDHNYFPDHESLVILGEQMGEFPPNSSKINTTCVTNAIP